MIGRTNVALKRRVLVVDEDVMHPGTAGGRAVAGIVEELRARGLEVVESASADDGIAVVGSDAAIHCVFVDWNLGQGDAGAHRAATELLRDLRRRNEHVPVFLMAGRVARRSLTIEVMQLADEFVWKLEDTAAFIAGRAIAAIERYAEGIMAPFLRAMLAYDRDKEYSWAAPGHQGGIAFTKSTVGRVFFDFYGENLFRTDTGIERAALGSLLGHSGPIGESERNTARVFGAHRSYSVLNGTSASNRVIFNAVVGDGEIALCDRNCHKSIEQGLIQSGGIPVFYVPSRNRYGIIGPISPSQFAPESIAQRIAANPLVAQAAGARPVYSVVTNSTYDGMCYHAKRASELLAPTVDHVHFDEAWYAYARFNPMYRDRHAMFGDPADHPADGPTVYATHSTHKLLAALSQASFLHVRYGRNAIDHHRFNESYCAQASTSPLYGIIASNDVATAMMDGTSGYTLTQEVIEEAVDFRIALARCHHEFAAKGQWFFAPWNAGHVVDPKTGNSVPFDEAPRELLTTDPGCWVLKPGDAWHGFADLDEGWCLLDPIKPGVICPGMQDDGTLAPQGIPAAIVSAYLARQGIIPSRTTDHMVLFLFSMGVTKGKWGTLVNTLLDFKTDYDANVALATALPKVAAAAPERYRNLGLRDLGDQMWEHMRKSRQGHWQGQAYSRLPTPVMPPREAFRRLMRGEAEVLPLDRMANRIVGVGVIPYPPGIPVVMPGENVGGADEPWLQYIRGLEEWGERFPGFEGELEGAELRDGKYHIYCLR
ncbi:MAG: Orn/Lys/Arg decarboxylase N-terminal domain-containing protein [Candidatus Levyibacteriota bacterium]